MPANGQTGIDVYRRRMRAWYEYCASILFRAYLGGIRPLLQLFGLDGSQLKRIYHFRDGIGVKRCTRHFVDLKIPTGI